MIWLQQVHLKPDRCLGRLCHSGAKSIYRKLSRKTTPLAQLQSYCRRAKSDHAHWSSIAPQDETNKMYWAQWDSLSLKDGVVYRLWETPAGDSTVWQLLLPKKLRAEVLHQLHDAETSKTLKRVRERFYSVGCSQDVKHWCSSCDTCASRKGPPRAVRAPMAQYNVGAPMERIAVDVLGPLPESESGNKYLLIVADYFSKWTEAFPIYGKSKGHNRCRDTCPTSHQSLWSTPVFALRSRLQF